MRDPKRIDAVLAIIKEIWEKDPDLRLMQLILNAFAHNIVHPGTYQPDPYFLEDDILIEKLKTTYRLT